MRDVTRLKVVFLPLALASALSCGGKSPTSPTTSTKPPSESPTPTVPSSVTLTGQFSFPRSGDTSQLKASATYADGSSRDVTSTCTWQSNNAAIVTISQTGLMTARSAGTTYVTATYNGKTDGSLVAVRALDLPGESPLEPARLAGSWRNVDPAAPGIVQVDIRADNGAFVVRPWGSCLPTACDWGEQTTSVSDGGDGVLSLTWQPPFAVMTAEIRLLQDGRLEVWLHEHYTDASGRRDFDSADYLHKTM